MNHSLYCLFLFAALLGGGVASTLAQEPPAAAEAAAPTVAEALSHCNILQGEPNTSAKYYIYLQSASWCGPCQQIMPLIVETYPQFKDAGIEVILCCLDGSEEEAKAYADSHKVPFPVVMGRGDAEALPGYSLAKGIPHMIAVTSQGRVLTHGHPVSLLRNDRWKTLLERWETLSESIPASLQKMSFLKGTPSLEAQYYVYLESASTCGPCHAAMPLAVQAYPELKESGVELILCDRDKTVNAAMKYAARYDIPFPMVLVGDAAAPVPAGFHPAGSAGIPHVTVYSRKGEFVWEGHPSFFFPDDCWKKILPH